MEVSGFSKLIYAQKNSVGDARKIGYCAAIARNSFVIDTIGGLLSETPVRSSPRKGSVTLNCMVESYKLLYLSGAITIFSKVFWFLRCQPAGTPQTS